MITERHYDDAALIYLMESGLPDDPHVAVCHQCSESLAAYRAIREVLGEEAVWDLRELNDEPVPQTIATLRAFASDMASEDAEADAILARLLAGPRESWLPRLAQHPEWRTAGVVRRLIAATDHALDTMPPDAVEITALATDIADHLPATTYPSETVLKLRGAAWRERGYALYYVGRYQQATAAISRSERAFAETTVDAYDIARAKLVRARIYRMVDATSDALMLSRSSKVTFGSFGDVKKQSVARETEAMVLYKSGDIRGAARIWHEVERSLPADELHTRGMLLQNLGHAYREVGDFASAQHHFELAADVFNLLGVVPNTLRAQWHVSKMLTTRGEHGKAAQSLFVLREKFAALEMQAEVASISLDLAEICLLLHRYDEVRALCHDVSRWLAAECISHTPEGLTALAYLQEASAAGAEATVVHEIRRLVRTVPKERFVFLPPPD
ncbi:MAG TPA: hypothetical protein VGR02_11580 [Thermoanaerobaculia bacterium]|jgi:tetratricopeptide (TPR) repeat protein|nr:hypothetical protein [Thermoanaerobaculia bacterium]